MQEGNGMTYMISDYQKIEVVKTGNAWKVTFSEKMGNRWVKLGEPEIWTNIEDVKEEYGI